MSKKSGNVLQDGLKILGGLAGVAISVAAIVLETKAQEEKISEYSELSHKDSKIIKKVDYIYHCDRLFPTVKGRLGFYTSISDKDLYDHLLKALLEGNTTRFEIALEM